jgi:hypothetical protein
MDPLRTWDHVGQGYWERVAETLSGLESVKMASYEPADNSLILTGKAAGPGRGMHLADLALALENVHQWREYGRHPLGMTIDPDTLDFYGPEQIVRYFGGCENTHCGKIMFECDRLLKCLGAGKDNITGNPLTSRVPGFKNLLQRDMELQGRSDEVFNRFWFVLYAPEVSDRNFAYRTKVLQLERGKGAYFERIPVFVRTEVMKRVGNKLESSFDEIDPKAEAFAEHFNSNYDRFAAENDVFRQLEQIANLTSLALWMEEERIPLNYQSLVMYRRGHYEHTPSRTPSVRNSVSETSIDTVRTDRGYEVLTSIRSVEIFGGVEFEPRNFYERDEQGKGASLLGHVRDATRESDEAISFGLRHGAEDYVAVAFPDQKKSMAHDSRRKSLDARIEVSDQSGIDLFRYYSPYAPSGGDFGRYHSLGLPRFIAIPTRRSIYITGRKRETEVEVCECRLIDDIGSIDVDFLEPEIDQTIPAIYYPSDHQGVKGYYPSENLIKLSTGSIRLDPKTHVPVTVTDMQDNSVHYEWRVDNEKASLQSIHAHKPDAPPAAVFFDRNEQNVIERVFGSESGLIQSQKINADRSVDLQLKKGDRFTIDGNGDCVAIQTPRVELSLEYEERFIDDVECQRIRRIIVSRPARGPPSRRLFRVTYGKQDLVGDIVVDNEQTVSSRFEREGLEEIARYTIDDIVLETSKNGLLHEITIGGDTEIDINYSIKTGGNSRLEMRQQNVIVDEGGGEPGAIYILQQKENVIRVVPAAVKAAYSYDERGALVEFHNVATGRRESYTYHGPNIKIRRE